MSTKHRDMMFGLALVYLGLMKGGLARDNRSTEVQKTAGDHSDYVISISRQRPLP